MIDSSSSEEDDSPVKNNNLTLDVERNSLKSDLRSSISPLPEIRPSPDVARVSTPIRPTSQASKASNVSIFTSSSYHQSNKDFVPEFIRRESSQEEKHQCITVIEAYINAKKSAEETSSVIDFLNTQRYCLYVYLLRVITTPFNVRKPTEYKKRKQRLKPADIIATKKVILDYLKKQETQRDDEAFVTVLQNYYNKFLNSTRLSLLASMGGCSKLDLKQVFTSLVDQAQSNIHEFTKPKGATKDVVKQAWLERFDEIVSEKESEVNECEKTCTTKNEPPHDIFSKEHLFQSFQSILSINSMEHQLLYNVCQLDNLDEQTAEIRRELDNRSKYIESLSYSVNLRTRPENQTSPEYYKNTLIVQKIRPKPSDQESLPDFDQYIKELRMHVQTLRSNLESLPVLRDSSEPRTAKRFSRVHSSSALSKSQQTNDKITKNNINLKYQAHVVILEVRGVRSIPPSKQIYCTIELDGSEKLATPAVACNRARFGTSADFETKVPRSVLKIKLFAKSNNILQIDDTVLGKVEIEQGSENKSGCQWYAMMISSGKDKGLTIQIAFKLTIPHSVKMSGHIWAYGKTNFQKWQRRYLILVQASQYSFALCEFQKRKSKPIEVMPLDGFIVDYMDNEPSLDLGKGQSLVKKI